MYTISVFFGGPGCHHVRHTEDANNKGETSHDESGSLMIQELDAKFEGRFQQLESLIRSLADTKRNREDSDDVPSGRAYVGGKRAKTGPPATRTEPQQADNSSDKGKHSEGEIVDDSVSVGDPEDDLLSALDKDLHEEEITAPPVSESLAKLTNNHFQTSLNVEMVKERMEKYPRPENCTSLVALEVNKEIWKSLSK